MAADARKSSIDVKVKLNGAVLDNVSDIPDLGGTRENIEVTAIGDGTRKYIAGIKEEASELEFTCWYEKKAFEDVKALEAKGEKAKVTIEIGDLPVDIEGFVSAALAGFGVGDALTYTMRVNVSSITIGAAAKGEE